MYVFLLEHQQQKQLWDEGLKFQGQVTVVR